MFILQKLSYSFPNKDLLFENISLTVNQGDKIALIGKNGIGKSTLLQVLSGTRKPSAGQLQVHTRPYYLPQNFGQFNQLSISKALGVEEKLNALHAILGGQTTEANYTLLNEDWTIESRCEEALSYWKIDGLNLTQKMAALSGGQKTRVLLASISIHQPALVLMDEPGNHLDYAGRHLLYRFIQSTSSTLIIVSHDHTLLNQLNVICEMKRNSITRYGGNYDFYTEQKQIEIDALNQDLQNKESSLRKARQKRRESIARQQKLNARGKEKGLKSGMPKILINKLKNDAENSSAKLKQVHHKRVNGIAGELADLRDALHEIDKMKFGFKNSRLHKGKIMFRATGMNYSYGQEPLWKDPISLQINSGERLAIKGLNGSGKTTLIKIILADLNPQIGKIMRADITTVYVDQDYTLIDNSLTIQEQAQHFNTSALKKHEVNTRLNRFLFGKNSWDKSCSALSGGERMRLILCCLTLYEQAPDLIILDEPTNNLDIQNIEILTKAINQYQGTLIVVSHDARFLEEIQIQRNFELR